MQLSTPTALQKTDVRAPTATERGTAHIAIRGWIKGAEVAAPGIVMVVTRGGTLVALPVFVEVVVEAPAAGGGGSPT